MIAATLATTAFSFSAATAFYIHADASADERDRLERQRLLLVASPNVRRTFDNADPSVSLAHRSTLDLLRSALIFELCQFPQIVDYTPRMIEAARSMGLEKPLFWLIRNTFFQQFCGGETADEVVPSMQSIKQQGIGSILDLSVEADDLPSNADQEAVDRKADGISALIRQCIETAARVPGSYAAVKVTALGSTKALRNLSHSLLFTRDLFYREAAGGMQLSHSLAGEFGVASEETILLPTIDQQQFASIIRKMPGFKEDSQFNSHVIDHLFRSIDTDGDGKIDWIDFSQSINIDNLAVRKLFIGRIALPSVTPGSIETYWSVSSAYNPEITEDDLSNFDKIQNRMDSLCQVAQRNNISLMIDAEQTYFQPAIDYLAIQMMRRYNRDLQSTQPPVFSTYQMYLKDGHDRLMIDMKMAERFNENNRFMFAVKLVRGAYMSSERARATSLQIKDPIQQTQADTHRAYDSAVETLLLKSSSSSTTTASHMPISLIIASHNRESIIQACEKMQALSLPSHGHVKFAQLYGMHDHLSFTLAHNGYDVCKYIPYGPVEDVIPYLLRRAQENRSVLVQGKTGNDDRSLLWRELKRRLFGDFRKTGGVPEGLEGYVKTVDE